MSRAPRAWSLLPAAAVLVVLAVAGPARAQDADADEEGSGFCGEGCQEFLESSGEYFRRSGTYVLAGVNGIATAPADFVMDPVKPPEALDELWGVPITNRLVGLPLGALHGTYRMLMGVTDIVLSPLRHYQTSPEPRYNLFPWVEYERGL